MPLESSLRDQIRDLLKALPAHVTQHEDKFTKGIPDTSFAFDVTKVRLPGHYFGQHFSGWLELKHHHTWPRLWTTELKVGIRPEQRIWIRERWPHGKDVWIVIRMEDDIYMFYGKDVDELYFPISRSRFDALWVGKWFKKIDVKEFVEIICETKSRVV